MKEIIDIIYVIVGIIVSIGLIKIFIAPEDEDRMTLFVFTLWVVFILLLVAQIMLI